MDVEQVRAIVRVALEETFTAIGADIKNPGEVKEIQQDFAWMRSTRQLMRTARTTAITALVGACVTGLAAIVWHAISAAKASNLGG